MAHDSEGHELYHLLGRLTTEEPNPRTEELDRVGTAAVLRMIADEDATVARAVRRCLPQIESATELVVAALRRNGRLFYAGAGTSGRLGVLDASELPPTFGWDPDRAIGLIAGGRPTLVRSREGVEDRAAAAARHLGRHRFGRRDVLIGIAASRRTPYTLRALTCARERGGATILLCANPRKVQRGEFEEQADVVIPVVVGPEVVTGSTRMKAGTAQKMVLNMITTAAMVALGKTYRNLMVDLRATSAKLTERAKRILFAACALDREEAEVALRKARGSVKVAIVMSKQACDAATARAKLRDARGRVGVALGEHQVTA